MIMNANIFKNTSGTHKDYIEIAYIFLIEAYNELLNLKYNAKSDNENKIRDNLVSKAQKYSDKTLPFRWITEYPDIDAKNRIDIDIATPSSLINDKHAIKIECKIVGEDKYIDSKKSFNAKVSPTNGIMSFITGKYASDMPLAGMIGFVKTGITTNKIQKIENRLNNHKDIITLQNLQFYYLNQKFQYSYLSKHKRIKRLADIDIYHLFFDFT